MVADYDIYFYLFFQLKTLTTVPSDSLVQEVLSAIASVTTQDKHTEQSQLLTTAELTTLTNSLDIVASVLEEHDTLDVQAVTEVLCLFTIVYTSLTCFITLNSVTQHIVPFVLYVLFVCLFVCFDDI